MKKIFYMNKYTEKIDKLRNSRGWSIYKLSQESGIPTQSINKWFYNGAMITIPLLEQICQTFGITLGEFFIESDLVELTPEKKALHDDWCSLTKSEQAAVMAIVKSYKDKK